MKAAEEGRERARRSVTDGAVRVAQHLGEVREAGADEIGYYCEVTAEQFARIKQILGLQRRWTVKGGHTKPLYSLAEGSLWRSVFSRRREG